MSALPPLNRDDEKGFVLALVLFVMVALTLTVTGALLITQSDSQSARASVDSNRAFHVAHAGLMYFVADRNALRSDSIVYQMGGGRVVVRARRIAAYGLEETHEIAARATVTTAGGHEDVREVRQLAVVELRPIQPVAALATAARNVTLVGTISGGDGSAAGGCNPAARTNTGGLASVSGGIVDLRNASIAGQPRTQVDADTAALRARISAEWDELIDPGMVYDYEFPAGAWPSFASVPLGTYPTIRVRGPFTATAARSGRGLLIVDGPLTLSSDFRWDGLIVAGSLAPSMSTNAFIRGSLLAGLSPGATSSLNIGATSTGYLRINYDACFVLLSQQRILRMRLMPNTWWEPNA